MLERLQGLTKFLSIELRKSNAYLLPLRIFLGFGWLRAGTEKLLDRGWHDGSELTAFITSQVEWSSEVFPFWGALLEWPLPLAAPLGVVVLVLQLLVGAAVVIGAFTNLALLTGLALNMAFLLSGVVNPNAFYVVIQLVLFFGSAGAVLGVDSRLSQRIHNPLLVAPCELAEGDARKRQKVWAVVAVTSVVLAVATTPFVSALAPALVLEDPALILLTMFIVSAGMASLAALHAADLTAQQQRRGRESTLQDATGHCRQWHLDDTEDLERLRWYADRLSGAAASLHLQLTEQAGTRWSATDLARQLGLGHDGSSVAGMLGWPTRYAAHLGKDLPIRVEDDTYWCTPQMSSPLREALTGQPERPPAVPDQGSTPARTRSSR